MSTMTITRTAGQPGLSLCRCYCKTFAFSHGSPQPGAQQAKRVPSPHGGGPGWGHPQRDTTIKRPTEQTDD